MPSTAWDFCVFPRFVSGRILILILAAGWTDVSGLIPRQCAHNASKADAVCCPTPPGSSEPCGGPGIGTCRRVQTYDEVLMYEEQRASWSADLRFRWPTHFFSFLCECQGLRFGVACDDCWFGRTGRSCSVLAPPLLRRNVLSLNARDRLVFRAVLSLSRRLPSDFVAPQGAGHFRRVSIHEALVLQHEFAARPSLVRGRCGRQFDCNHEGPAFPSWHRLFLLLWERQLSHIAEDQLGVRQFAVPYWDWTNETRCSPCVDDLIGNFSSPTSSSFLRRWPLLCPGRDCEPCASSGPLLSRDIRRLRLPTLAHVRSTLQRHVFFALDDSTPLSSDANCPSFARYFEGDCADFPLHRNHSMHNAVHRSVDGAMHNTRTSPNDPLFLLHHSQMDRVLQAWVLARRPTARDIPNTQTRPGHCRDCFLVGLWPPVKNGDMLVDLRLLGVRYDSLEFAGMPASNLTAP